MIYSRGVSEKQESQEISTPPAVTYYGMYISVIQERGGRQEKTSMRRLAAFLGPLLGFIGVLALITSWEPGSAFAKARVFAVVAFILCFPLIWYGAARRDSMINDRKRR
jgi:hypothetical protein